MESLIMNYSDEEDVFPSEDEAESNHFTSRTPNPDNDAVQENIMEIPDRPVKMLETFGLPVVKSPCDMKDAANNTIKSSIDQIEDDDKINMFSDEGDLKDVISSIIISRVEAVVDDQDYVVLCKSSTKATSPISSPSFVERGRTNTETTMDFDNSEYHNGSPFSNKADEETPTAATIPISSSSLVKQEPDLETSIDLDKCGNSPKTEREDEESDKENSTAATLPISFSFMLGQKLHTATAIGLDSSKSHNVSLIKDEEDGESDRETPAAGNFPILSSALVEQEADLETSIDLDMCGNSPKSEREDEKSDKDNSTAATLPISFSSLVRREAYTATAIDLNSSKSHNESPIENEGDQRIDLKDPIYSTDELSESQAESSLQFEANRCDTSTNSQKYQHKPVIFDRRTFKCKRCSYSSTIRFGLKRHMMTHSEDLDLNKIKCAHCPFETKTKKSLYNHWLVTHTKSKCTICDTFVPAHLKEKHLLKCKTRKNMFECKKCQYKTKYDRLFERHRIECINKKRSIPRKPEASRGRCGKLEKSKQRGEILERSKQLHRCEHCSYSTKVKGHLKKHILAHTVSNRPIYPCSKCNYKSLRESLTRHMMLTHKIKFKDTSLSVKSCNFCSFTTKYGPNLKKHLQLHTLRHEPIISCTKCDFKAPQITLTHHYKNIHRLQTENLGELTEPDHKRPIYHCSRCGYKSTERNFLKHVKTAHKTKSENNNLLAETKGLKKCSFCSYTSSRNDQVKYHRQLHLVRNEPIVRCAKCDYKAPKITLTYHYKNVHGSLMNEKEKAKQIYTCKFCSYTTKYGYYLEKHCQIHTLRNKPIISCTKCDYNAPRGALRIHYMNVHGLQMNKIEQTERLYTCKFCSYTSKHHHKVKRHLLSHTVQNSPVYSCPRCDYKSTNRNFLNHLKTVHKIEPKDFSSLMKTEGLKKCDYKAPQITDTRHYKNVHAPQKDNLGQLTETEYTCKFCSFTTHYQETLRKHTPLHTVHNSPIYHCPKCDYKSTKLNFFKHVKTAHKIGSKNIRTNQQRKLKD